MSDFATLDTLAHDPLGYTVPLSLEATFHPVGFPLSVSSNSPDILDAAAEAWGSFPALSIAPSAVLRVHVTDTSEAELPAPVMPRGQGHLVTIMMGPDHYAVCDVSCGYAFVSLTRHAARNHDWTRYHFLEPLGWLMIDALHSAPVHGSCIALDGRAVLLCGDGGAGKTTLAYACCRGGWTFLSGDATHLLRDTTGFEVRGRPQSIRFRSSARDLFQELTDFPVALRPSGKTDLEISPASLGLTTAHQAEASQIVFLNRMPNVRTARLDPIPREVALTRLTGLICFGDEAIQKAQRETIEHFTHLPTLELTYAETDSAQEVLRDLLMRSV